MTPPLSQVDAAGRLRHLVTLDGLPRTLIEELLDARRGLCLGRGTRRRAPRRHRRQPLRRAIDPDARLVRARGTAPGRERRQPRQRALVARQGRDAPRHRAHAARPARRRVRHARRRARRAGTGRARRRRQGRGGLGGRGPPVASDPGPARCADHSPGEGIPRPGLGRDRRRHRPLARRALRVPRARDPRRAGHPHRGATRDDAGGRGIRRCPPLRVAGRRASRARTSS